MKLLIPLKQLEEASLDTEGEIPAADLHLDYPDEVVRVSQPLTYSLHAELLEDSVLITGRLRLPVECDCVRCLKPVPFVLEFPDWVCHVPLTGEDKAELIGDSVDLTPHIREDIVLALPAHPVCREDCPGLLLEPKSDACNGSSSATKSASPWDELNKLKLNP